MIELTRINNSKFYLNEILIETMEEKPDTVITMRDGKKFVVKEKICDIIKLIKEYNKY